MPDYQKKKKNKKGTNANCINPVPKYELLRIFELGHGRQGAKNKEIKDYLFAAIQQRLGLNIKMLLSFSGKGASREIHLLMTIPPVGATTKESINICKQRINSAWSKYGLSLPHNYFPVFTDTERAGLVVFLTVRRNYYVK